MILPKSTPGMPPWVLIADFPEQKRRLVRVITQEGFEELRKRRQNFDDFFERIGNHYLSRDDDRYLMFAVLDLEGRPQGAFLFVLTSTLSLGD